MRCAGRKLRWLALLLALCLALTLAGCGEAASEASGRAERGEETVPEEPEQPEQSEQAQSPQAGFATEEELIQELLSCLASGEVSDAFWSAYDATGSRAYLISNDGGPITVGEAYDVLENSDRDAEFIRRHFPDFAEHWREDTGEELTDEALAQLLEEYAQLQAPTREEVEELIRNYHERFFTDGEVPAYDEENLWSSDYGYSEYDIPVSNPQGGVYALTLYYIYRDDTFRWIMLNQLVSCGTGG